MIFQVARGLQAALAMTLRGLWQSTSSRQRRGLAVVLATAALAVCLVRIGRSLHDAPPAWLRLESFSSPALSRNDWDQFEPLLEQAGRYAGQRDVPLGSVRLWEVQNEWKETILWTSDRFLNPGFHPIRNFERSFRTDLPLFIGYYASDGEALNFTVKHTPTRPKDLLLTVHLPSPVAPGSSELAFRRERRSERVRPTPDGKLQIGLGRMPAVATAIHLWAVVLPKNAHLDRITPDKDAFLTTNQTIRVFWVNARLSDPTRRISVVFSLPQ